ncbi:MAG: hypothetical protein U5L11_04160 [Arhodomonas sp.]|nr:hypothetical protein [Arhodomonas sp.]
MQETEAEAEAREQTAQRRTRSGQGSRRLAEELLEQADIRINGSRPGTSKCTTSVSSTAPSPTAT